MSNSSFNKGLYGAYVLLSILFFTVGLAVGFRRYENAECQYGTVKTMVKENDNYRIVCAAPSASVCPPADSILVGQTKKFKDGFQELAQICYEDRDKWQTALDQCRAERDIVSKMCCDQLEAYQKTHP